MILQLGFAIRERLPECFRIGFPKGFELLNLGLMVFTPLGNRFLVLLAPIGYCLSCSYDLTGNTTGRCPECGTRLESEVATISESHDV